MDSNIDGVRQDEFEVSKNKAGREKSVSQKLSHRPKVSTLICCHDNNWPYGQLCGGFLTRHVDGGDLVCEAGHRFAGY